MKFAKYALAGAAAAGLAFAALTTVPTFAKVFEGYIGAPPTMRRSRPSKARTSPSR